MKTQAEEKILHAFRDLVLERPYDDISVTDVVRLAGIGRSTFYEHYAGKRSLLIASMGWLLDILVLCSSRKGEKEAVEFLVSHMQQNRDIGRVLMNSSASFHICRALAEKIVEQNAVTTLEGTGMASSYMGVIRSWLTDELRCTEAEMVNWMLPE